MASSSQPSPLPAQPRGDPYVLDPAKIQEPPRGWLPSLRFLGPGLITSAAIVGSGELITATTLGAQAGFVLLWLVFVSTVVKVAVQIELARWAIFSGKPAIFGYDDVPPRIGGRSWLSYLALLTFLQFVTSQAGVLSAAGLAVATLVPIDGDPTSGASIGFWVALFVVLAIAIHRSNRYGVVERVSTILVVLVTFAVVVMVLGIQLTPFAYSGNDLASGMTFRIAAGNMGLALSMFGLTGVGALEITSYSFWCVEKGYAAWTGPNDGSTDWARRARGWIAVMKKDAWVAWVIYTLSTVSFYILGAAVLHTQGLAPQGLDVLDVISRIFTDTVGPWTGVAFLVFAAIALYKTILANVPSLARQTAASLAVFGFYEWLDTKARDRVLRALMVVMPILWGVVGVVVKSPLQLVILGGILNALYLMAVSVATVYLSYRQTDRRIKDGSLFTVYLLVSAAAVFAVGTISLFDIF